MDYGFTEEQKHIQELTRKIGRDKILPMRAQLDESEEFPWAIINTLAEVGLFGIYIPEEYGGLGFGNFENYRC